MPQPGIGEPFGRGAAQDAVAARALAGDDQGGAVAVVPGAEQEGFQGGAGAVLGQAVEVDAGLGALRVSIGRTTTDAEIARFLDAFERIAGRRRREAAA